MSELGSDSFNILKDYKEREKNGKYYYILKRAKYTNLISKVINSIEQNFKLILKINNTLIYIVLVLIYLSL